MSRQVQAGAIVLDRRDKLPDYYSDLVRVPSRSAKVFKRLSWNERIKSANLKKIESFQKKSYIEKEKEAAAYCDKLKVLEILKRNSQTEIERVKKLKEISEINLQQKKKQFYATFEKFEAGLLFEPLPNSLYKEDFKGTKQNGRPRLKSAIKQLNRTSSSKTNKSVSFNLSANTVHEEKKNKSNELSNNIANERKKFISLNELYAIKNPYAILPETGEEVIFKNIIEIARKY